MAYFLGLNLRGTVRWGKNEVSWKVYACGGIIRRPDHSGQISPEWPACIDSHSV